MCFNKKAFCIVCAVSTALNFLLLTVVVSDKSNILYTENSFLSDTAEENTASEAIGLSSAQDSNISSDLSSAADRYDKNVYLTEITQYGDIVIPYSADKDSSYMEQTLFIGDSNTAGLSDFGYLPLQNVLGKKSIGIQGVISDSFVWFENYPKPVNIVKAVKLLKPRRIIVSFGTNNTIGTTAAEFKSMYKKALYAIEYSYPHCDIIVASVLPVGYYRENYGIKQQTIDNFNIALAQLCSEDGYHFLDCSEVFKDTDSGYMKQNCVAKDGIHLNDKGYRLFLEYVNDHQLKTQDKRPDTDNISLRTTAPLEISKTPQAAAADIDDMPETQNSIDNGKSILDNNYSDSISPDSSFCKEHSVSHTTGSSGADSASDTSSVLGNISSEKTIYDPF